MICKISEIENTAVDTTEPIEIRLEDGIYRSVRFCNSVQKVTLTGGKARSGFIFESERPVTLVLKNCELSGMLGVPAIKKEKGELKIEVYGKNELCGCSASFGPSSFGESSAIAADKLTLKKADNATLVLHGGRTFASLFNCEAQYCSAVVCNEFNIE